MSFVHHLDLQLCFLNTANIISYRTIDKMFRIARRGKQKCINNAYRELQLQRS